MFPKLSLLSLYLRIFVDRGVRIGTFVAMGFVVVFGLTFTLGGLFACHPVQYFCVSDFGCHAVIEPSTAKNRYSGNRLIPSGHCMSLNLFYRINTPFNIIVDIAILIIPVPALWKLQAPLRKKVGLTFVFSMGGL